VQRDVGTFPVLIAGVTDLLAAVNAPAELGAET
jgi:hypothetical protein